MGRRGRGQGAGGGLLGMGGVGGGGLSEGEVRGGGGGVEAWGGGKIRGGWEIAV